MTLKNNHTENKLFSKYQMDIEPLLKSLRDKNCVIVLGAGIGKIANMPDGKKLAEILSDNLKTMVADGVEKEQIDEIKYDLAKVSEVYSHKISELDLKRLVCNTIEQYEKDPHTNKAIYKALSSLPPCIFITTNYDKLLEDSFSSTMDYETFFKEENMHISPNPATNIYKIHGDRTDPKSIVITKNDYDKWLLPENYKAFKDKLRVLFREKTILIIGYSAEDINFRSIFKSVYYELKSQTKKHYFVIYKDDNWIEEEWQDYGFKFIHGDAKEFIHDILNETKERDIKQPMIEKKTTDFNMDQNPFKYISAETVKKGDEDIIQKYFIEPLEFNKLIAPGQNTIIEGHRGSGKSWLLRFLCMKLQQSTESLCFYIKCMPEAFISVDREIDSDLTWTRFFLHYFNLYVITNVTESISELFTHEEKNALVKSLKGLFPDISKDINTIPELLDWLYQKMDLCSGGYYNKIEYTGPHHIYRFFNKIYEIRKFKNIYILLDEYDNLFESQQKVVNYYLRGRNAPPTYNFNLNYKIGVKSGCMFFMDLKENLLKMNDDYNLILLDKFTENAKIKYSKFLRDVANIRLKEDKYNITDIEELLPAMKYPIQEEPNYIGDDYSGFQNYVYLSSGIVRDFVSLVKDTLYFSFEEISIKKVELKPIPPKLQNHVIKMKSAIHYHNYEEDIKDPEKVKQLIDALGELFRTIQKYSRENYYKQIKNDEDSIKSKDLIRRTSQIGIETINTELDPILIDLIKQAVSVQLLQIPLLPREPQITRKSPFYNIKFHRLLTPYFSLAIQNRHPRNIKTEVFNIILKDRNHFISELMKKWDDFVPQDQMILEFDRGEV